MSYGLARYENEIAHLRLEDDLEWQNGLQSYFSEDPTFEIISCVGSIKACKSALSETNVNVVLLGILLNDPAGA